MVFASFTSSAAPALFFATFTATVVFLEASKAEKTVLNVPFPTSCTAEKTSGRHCSQAMFAKYGLKR